MTMRKRQDEADAAGAVMARDAAADAVQRGYLEAEDGKLPASDGETIWSLRWTVRP